MKVQITTTIDGISPDKYAKKLRQGIIKGQKGSATTRAVVLRYFSDFISQQGKLREATTSGNFSKASARPDIQGSLSVLKSYFGIDLQPTAIKGGAQAYAELKQRTSGDRAVTLTSLQLAGGNLARFTSEFGLTEAKKEDGQATFFGTRVSEIYKNQAALIKFIKSEPALENEIMSAIREKFENFVVIDYLDKEHGARPKVKVLANAASILGLTALNSGAIVIEPRVTYSSNKTKAFITFSFKLSDSAYSEFIKKATDATATFHSALSKTTSTKFIKYALSRFNASGKVGLAEFITEVVSIAKEFEVGSDTPIVYESIIERQAQGISTVRLGYTIGSTKKNNTQKFISGTQWTVLTQARLGITMAKTGVADPPELKERTGRFRKSIAVRPDYKRQVLNYTYNPLYRSLERYGYTPSTQIETAIREVAQQLYATQFRIVRG
jgi:hypothetical protein